MAAPKEMSVFNLTFHQNPELTSFFPLRNVDVLVIGAGPTGLGAAKRLQQTVLCPLSTYQRVLLTYYKIEASIMAHC